MIKIGFDAKRIFNNSTGLGNYSRTLVDNLIKQYPENQYFLFTPKIKLKHYEDHYSALDNVTIITPEGFHPLWRSHGISRLLEREDIDIYHGLSHDLPYNIPPGINKIVTIHDIIFKKFPDQFSIIDRQLYQRKWDHAIHSADHIIAISDNTKRDILEYFDVNESKIHVVYQAASSQFYHQNIEDQQQGDYYISVGSLIERKNYTNLIKAFAHSEIKKRLFIIGNGNQKDELQDLINEFNLEDQITIKFNVENDDLINLMKSSNALIYPSIYEGFGLPALEARLLKKPVIASQLSSVPEAAGQNAYYFDPYDIESIQNAILSYENDSDKASRALKSYEDALDQFDPQFISQQIMKIYLTC